MTLDTQLSGIHTTATAANELLMITVEYADTQVAHASTQQSLILATLGARGVDTNVLPGVVTPAPTTSNLPTPGVSVNNSITITPVLVATRIPVTPFTTTPQPVQVNLGDIVTATSVGDDDCATGVTDQFTPTSERIYVVARAYQIEPGQRSVHVGSKTASK